MAGQAARVLVLVGEAGRAWPANNFGDPLPPGVLLRLGTGWLRDWLAPATFSTGRALARGLVDGTVLEWDLTAKGAAAGWPLKNKSR